MKNILRGIYNLLIAWNPRKIISNRSELKIRLLALKALIFHRQSWQRSINCCDESQLPSRILIDGTWDNPNYWFRQSLVHAALGNSKTQCIGLLGRYSRQQVKNTFNCLGIREQVDYAHYARANDQHYLLSKELLSGVNSPDDVLNLAFPKNFPASLVFDAILKRQRSATVDVTDPEIVDIVADALAHIDAAETIVSEGDFDLVLLSHALDYTYAAIAWAALSRNISVLALYGDYGTSRFFHLKTYDDLFAYPSRPTVDELDGMTVSQSKDLGINASQQLSLRMQGLSGDVGAVYAYQLRTSSINRNVLAEEYDWDISKPIIAVYNSNWFDYPHASGLHDFRDFLDWITQTLEVAAKNTNVNWLFKAHPCDDWYASINGVRLEDLIDEMNLPHIKLCNKSWNGSDLMQCLDGIVTCHGTVGLEATALGIPVLVPYAGWYGHAGFVACSKNRADYLALLNGQWWLDLDIEKNRKNAEIFFGCMFCVPYWQNGYILPDDSLQNDIYSTLSDLLSKNGRQIECEVKLLRDWFLSGQKYFHIYKILNADNYIDQVSAADGKALNVTG